MQATNLRRVSDLLALVELGAIDGHVLEDQLPVGVVEQGQTSSSTESCARSHAGNITNKYIFPFLYSLWLCNG